MLRIYKTYSYRERKESNSLRVAETRERLREWAGLIWARRRRQRRREAETREWLRVGWAERMAMSTTERGRDERAIESGLAQARRRCRRSREAETREWWREWGRGRSEIANEKREWGFSIRIEKAQNDAVLRKKKKKGTKRRRFETKQGSPFEPSEPFTVHRTGRSDCGPYGSMLFSHGTVLHLKWTVDVNGSRVLRSNRTVRSRSKFHGYQKCW